jgi:hypothetical protein
MVHHGEGLLVIREAKRKALLRRQERNMVPSDQIGEFGCQSGLDIFWRRRQAAFLAFIDVT